MKYYILLIALAIYTASSAQVLQVNLEASGLTCSMCSNSINKSLKTLDFVERVEPDIKKYEFKIFFKPNSNVDFDLIRRKVESAGFAVSSFYADIRFDNTQVTSDKAVSIGDNALHFTNTKDRILNGIHKIKITNPGFVSSLRSKEKTSIASVAGTYNATIL